jgi:hypothetical protein
MYADKRTGCQVRCDVHLSDTWWDFRFSWQRVWRWLFSEMLRRVVSRKWLTFQRCLLLPSSGRYQIDAYWWHHVCLPVRNSLMDFNGIWRCVSTERFVRRI